MIALSRTGIKNFTASLLSTMIFRMEGNIRHRLFGDAYLCLFQRLREAPKEPAVKASPTSVSLFTLPLSASPLVDAPGRQREFNSERRNIGSYLNNFS